MSRLRAWLCQLSGSCHLPQVPVALVGQKRIGSVGRKEKAGWAGDATATPRCPKQKVLYPERDPVQINPCRCRPYWLPLRAEHRHGSSQPLGTRQQAGSETVSLATAGPLSDVPEHAFGVARPVPARPRIPVVGGYCFDHLGKEACGLSVLCGDRYDTLMATPTASWQLTTSSIKAPPECLGRPPVPCAYNLEITIRLDKPATRELVAFLCPKDFTAPFLAISPDADNV
ncbi:hypothetical protein Micbo1qcDRAFT_180417 [Microdochium bolleyi]|uniref:Uncharacterized protein n=1 Tax=Microdochium bolleyi TaxID=196109 RepID=A0A136IMK8_9PEZI|nr:hypothetical protein Micbo1qcDRAFT_180417 [Microdochium bolleyi]